MNQADANEYIEDTNAADNAAKRGMQNEHAKSLRQMAEKIVLLPESGPGEVEKERTHLQTKDDQDYAKRFVHERESVRPWKQGSASGFLKGSDAVGNVAIINVGRIDLRKAFERPFNITRRFLGNA